MSAESPSPAPTPDKPARPADAESRLAKLTSVFTPAIPVSQSAVFAGRLEQIQQVVDGYAGTQVVAQ